MKSVFLAMLALAALVAGTARADEPKSFKVNLNDSRIGSVNLNAGEYRILVHQDESKVQIKDPRTGEVKDLEAKVENQDSKFPTTEIHTQKVDGVTQINEIRIGGTKFRIDFRPGT